MTKDGVGGESFLWSLKRGSALGGPRNGGVLARELNWRTCYFSIAVDEPSVEVGKTEKALHLLNIVSRPTAYTGAD